MKEEIDAAKKYIIDDLIAKWLITGDYLIVIGFIKILKLLHVERLSRKKTKKR